MNSVSFSFWRLARANLLASPRSSAALVLGLGIATAVIVGALVVGDSMRTSLRALTIERLGRIETVIAPGTFFDINGLGIDRIGIHEVGGINEFGGDGTAAVILFPGATAESMGDVSARAAGITAIAIDQHFWQLDVIGGTDLPVPSDSEVILNESLARELGVIEGDMVTIRLPTEGAVPADSPLGKSESTSEGLPRMTVRQVIPDRGLGRFGLSANQVAPMNAYLNRETVAEVLDREGQANAILSDRALTVATINEPEPESVDGAMVRVDLADLGLKLESVKIEFGEGEDRKIVTEYQHLTSEQLLLPDPVVSAIDEAGSLAKSSGQSAMTYLANAIERLDESGKVIATVPYSILTAIDPSPSLPLNYEMPATSESADSSVVPLVINDWTAKQLDATVGTSLRIAYYEPEVENGNEVERYFDAVVTAVVPITEPSRPYRRRRAAEFDQPPTVYNDPNLTPSVPGVTDQDSISDWDLPFTLEREISRQDDDYWNRHRLTPKAFMPLSDGRRLFGSRFGNVTSIRFVGETVSEADLLKLLTPKLDALGWSPMSIREQQLAASSGTTPFDGLFLALSFFVIFSAILLVVMLLRLSMQTRLKQLGVMAATGWTMRRITRLLLVEGAILCGIGAVVGGVLGIGYGKLILNGLTTRWVGAVTVPFLQFHASPTTLIAGVVAGFLISMLTVVWVCRGVGRRSPQALLSGRDDEASLRTTSESRFAKWSKSIAWGLIGLAIIVMVVGGAQGGVKAAGGLVGGAMLWLIAALMFVYRHLATPEQGTGDVHSASQVTRLRRLSQTNASRSPTRSTLAIGLMAVASFLIVAMTAFSLSPTDGGTGGYEWIATASAPIYKDISQREVQRSILGPDAQLLDGMTIEPIRRRLGQDASCNNLYRADAPTVLGMRADFSSDRDGSRFDWASHVPMGEDQNVWSVLQQSAIGSETSPIPVIIDQNTAMWSLGMTRGIGEIKSFTYDDQTLFFEVAGLLAGSTLQGRLMISESNFNAVFPDISGYSFFLIDAGDRSAGDSKALAAALENRLSDNGVDVRRSEEVLAGLLAVQNTYLKTFQSLGALGLLLGTFGLAAAQWRSVLQRRGELGVMRAIGFTRRRLALMVVGETTSLLVVGVGCGLACALIGVVPIWIGGGVPPDAWSPILNVLGIMLFGIVVGVVVAAGVLRMPLVDSLRSEE